MIHDSGNLPGGIKIEREREREREREKLKTKGNKKGKKKGKKEKTLEYLMTLPKVKQQGIFGDH
jgi:hypothetical protein